MGSQPQASFDIGCSRFPRFARKQTIIVDVIIILVCAGIVGMLLWSALTFPETVVRQGIMLDLSATVESSRRSSITLKIPWTIAAMAAFLVSNSLWLAKLHRMGKGSVALSKVAIVCLKIMCVQLVLLSLALAADFVHLGAVTIWGTPWLNVNGELDLIPYHVWSTYVEPPVEALLGLSQVTAIRLLSSQAPSSSSTSSSSSSSAGKTQLETSYDADSKNSTNTDLQA